MNKFNMRNPYIFKKMYFFKHIFNKNCKYKSKLIKFNNNLYKQLLLKKNTKINSNISFNSLLFDENNFKEKINMKLNIEQNLNKNTHFYNNLILNIDNIKKKKFSKI